MGCYFAAVAADCMEANIDWVTTPLKPQSQGDPGTNGSTHAHPYPTPVFLPMTHDEELG